MEYCPVCRAAQPTDAHLLGEYSEMGRACFGVFARNAQEAQNTVARLLLAHGVTHVPNIFGAIPIRLRNREEFV